MIDSTITGTAHHEHSPKGIRPFAVGDLDPDKGYVHVLDDTTLDIVMSTLDTITDFVDYLTRKEAFMRSGRAVMAAGEEDLLAFYMSDVDENEQHDFIVSPDDEAVFIDEGLWEEFKRLPQRQAQLEANDGSYRWDALIEQFNRHIIGGTQYYTSHMGVESSERSVRLLAREGRLRRRMLAKALLGVVDQELPEGGKATRVVLPSRPGDPYYVFVLIRPPKDVDYDKFREVRGNELHASCMVLKAIYPDAEDIVGIATEDRTAGSRSEDVLYLNARVWNDSLQSEALELQERLNILRETTNTFRERVLEYPEVQLEPRNEEYRTTHNMKGRDRNSPCPCGSGKKFKKCCGSTTAKPKLQSQSHFD